MAITSITVVQDNLVGGCYLLSAHNPLVFIVEANYTSSPPTSLHVNDNTGSNVYSCIPYSDPQPGKRQFMFIADEIIRGTMNAFDDVVQADNTAVHRPAKTMGTTFVFFDPLAPTTLVPITFVAIHASRQFGESPSLNSIYENTNDSYIGVVGSPCYVYFYNQFSSNVITLTVA